MVRYRQQCTWRWLTVKAVQALNRLRFTDSAGESESTFQFMTTKKLAQTTDRKATINSPQKWQREINNPFIFTQQWTKKETREIDSLRGWQSAPVYESAARIKILFIFFGHSLTRSQCTQWTKRAQLRGRVKLKEYSLLLISILMSLNINTIHIYCVTNVNSLLIWSFHSFLFYIYLNNFHFKAGGRVARAALLTLHDEVQNWTFFPFPALKHSNESSEFFFYVWWIPRDMAEKNALQLANSTSFLSL